MFTWWKKRQQEKEEWRKIAEKVRNPPPLSLEKKIAKLDKAREWGDSKGWPTSILLKVEQFYSYQLREKQFMEKYREIPTDEYSLNSMQRNKKLLDRAKEYADEFIKVEGMPRTDREAFDDLTQEGINGRDFERILVKMETEEWRKQYLADREVPEAFRLKKEREERELKEQQETAKAAKTKEKRDILTAKQKKIRQWAGDEPKEAKPEIKRPKGGKSKKRGKGKRKRK